MTREIPTAEELSEKIKSRGFWEVIIRPLKFEENRLETLGECGELVQQCKVRLRGWDYPHISRHYGIRSGVDWVENLTDWEGHKELWRMYQSGQFYHLFSCLEDWERIRIFWGDRSYTEPGYGLSFVLSLYKFTEIYEFAARLAKKNLFDDLVKVSVTLHGMMDRRLVTLDVRRSLHDNYICSIEKIPLSRTMSVEEIVSKSNEYAVDDAFRVFERFNWLKAPVKVLAEIQNALLKGEFQ